MGVGTIMMNVSYIRFKIMERIRSICPGEISPSLCSQYRGSSKMHLLRQLLVTWSQAYLGSFLMIRNLSLIGDGLAHVTFGGVCGGLFWAPHLPLGMHCILRNRGIGDNPDANQGNTNR